MEDNSENKTGPHGEELASPVITAERMQDPSREHDDSPSDLSAELKSIRPPQTTDNSNPIQKALQRFKKDPDTENDTQPDTTTNVSDNGEPHGEENEQDPTVERERQ